MTAKRQRLLFILLALVFFIGGTLFIMNAFRSNLVFFFSPSELEARQPKLHEKIRIGGLVETGSLKTEGERVSFIVTDFKKTLAVEYSGILPALFREGQGVVAEGEWEGEALFRAKTLLAKHDENYMPPEVAAALKKNEHWREKQMPQKQEEAP